MDAVFWIMIVFSAIVFAFSITMTIIGVVRSIKNSRSIFSQARNLMNNNQEISKNIFKKLSTNPNGETTTWIQKEKKYCEYCGVEIKEDASKCGSCGAPTRK